MSALTNTLPYTQPEWIEPFHYRVTVVDNQTGRMIRDYGLMGENGALNLVDMLRLAMVTHSQGWVTINMSPSYSFPHSHGRIDHNG